MVEDIVGDGAVFRSEDVAGTFGMIEVHESRCVVGEFDAYDCGAFGDGVEEVVGSNNRDVAE